jgi:hypothetical protein
VELTVAQDCQGSGAASQVVSRFRPTDIVEFGCEGSGASEAADDGGVIWSALMSEEVEEMGSHLGDQFVPVPARADELAATLLEVSLEVWVHCRSS